ncbi:hypothetical protein E6O75_ATG03195 [Venturia nashicola]|uniref:DUF6697 domain-containing protein n=1 Tax=Venturia nashicola TaxID=86259 RepID=A0A4Z1P9E0_9PEZI|nr:hypothetical protein E6O75_ATG03195 [Venturia nashicola]
MNSGAYEDSISAVVDELCSLRRDVDILNNGGWNVKMGPFERSKDLTDIQVAAIRREIAGRLNGSATKPNGSLSLDGVSDRQENPIKPVSKPMAPKSLATSLPPRGLVTSLPPRGLATSLPPRGMATSLTQSAKGLATSLAQPVKDLATGLATSLTPPPKSPATSSTTQLPIRNPTPATVPVTEMEAWKPSYIRSLKALDNLKVPAPGVMQTFTRDLINNIFGGNEHSPSLFFIPTAIENPLLPQRTYYLMDSLVEPFLPSTPGQHGAKLTPFFNNNSPEGSEEDASYTNVPLFISSSAYAGPDKAKANEYVYFGTYSQTRWSDKLDSDRLRDVVPQKVVEYWAATLADLGRPEWMSAALAKHFYPPPEYLGTLPTSEEEAKQVGESRVIMNDVEDFLREMAAWKIYSAAEVSGMGKEDMLKAFEKADADAPAGLRLWFEYLECTMWDEGFYKMLVKSQTSLNNGGRIN